jgi:hypothetical protein
MNTDVETTTEAPKATSTLQPQATPYILQAEVPFVDVEVALKEEWDKAKAQIPAKEWAGYRIGTDAYRSVWEKKLGLFNAYRPVWIHMLDRAAASHKKFVLDYQEMTVVEDAARKVYKLGAVIHFVPGACFDKSVNLDEIPVEVYSMHPTLIENGVKAKVEQAIEQQGKFTLSDTPVAEGNEVLVDIEASLDGKPWKNGSVSKRRIRAHRNRMFPRELFDALIDKKAGDKFEVECKALPQMYGPDAGRHFTASVSLLEVCVPVGETADEFAKRIGYAGGEEEMKNVFREEVKKSMEENREKTISELSLHYLRSNSLLDPVPFNWLRERARGEYKRLLERNTGKSEREVLVAAGANKPSELIASYMAQVADFMRDEAVILSYGVLHGQVDYDLDIGANFEKIREFIKTKIKIVEVEPLSAKAGNA